jgi:alkylhydroperoxidase family enzyme
LARLPYADIDRAGPELRESFARLAAPLNIFRMMAHAETCFKPLTRLGGAMLGKLALDARLRELALLYTVRLEGGTYEWVQHVPVARKLGVSEAQIAALETGNTDAPCFDARDRALLRFTTEVVERVGASAESLADLRTHLSDREAVELVLMIGFYMMLARLTETTGVELAAPAGEAVLASIERRLAEKGKAASP